MPRKSTGPYLGPPTWLKAEREKPLEQSPTYATRDLFIAEAMGVLIANKLTVRQAAEVTANACGEARWGKACYWYNAGGWKITQAFAVAFKKVHGVEPEWWKARGNVDSGDPDWCFYRVFPDLLTFLLEWCKNFVPQPGTVGDKHRYKATGERFWGPRDPHDPRTWFGDMIVAGYKGAPSAARMKAIRDQGHPDNEHPSVVSQISITQDVLEVWAQTKLGVDPDGAWGPKSKTKCEEFQHRLGLLVTGYLDDPTLLHLSKLPTPPPPTTP